MPSTQTAMSAVAAAGAHSNRKSVLVAKTLSDISESCSDNTKEDGKQQTHHDLQRSLNDSKRRRRTKEERNKEREIKENLLKELSQEVERLGNESSVSLRIGGRGPGITEINNSLQS